MAPARSRGRAEREAAAPCAIPPAAAAPPAYYEEIVNSAQSNLATVTDLLRESEKAMEGVFKAIKAKELSAVRLCRCLHMLRLR